MKITIRKKDSVTNVVLFVYNVIGETSNNYSIRLDHLLELMQLFGKSETSIRTGLSRMVTSGILVNRKQDNQIYFDLSHIGAKYIAMWNRGLKRYFSRYVQKSNGWNGQWNVISIDDFNKSDYSNTEILEELYECGLREFNQNVWVTPGQIDEILDQLRSAGFHYYNFCGSLSTDKDKTSLINSVFETDTLKQKYVDFLQRTKELPDIIDSKTGGELLPILFNVGWEFYNIVTMDPVLPKELCEMSEGDKATERMNTIRQAAIKKIIEYLKLKDI